MSDPREDMMLTEQGLQVATRLVALVRAGRAYSVEHPGFAQPLATFAAVVESLVRERPSLRLETAEGDIHVDGQRLPFRPHMQRSLEQLVQEFDARGIAGLEFLNGISGEELRRFMAYFLPSERYKGHELTQAASAAGVHHVRIIAQGEVVLRRGVVVQSKVLPAALGPSREAWGAFHGMAEALLTGEALEQGIELRHLQRLAAPWIDALIAGESTIAALAAISPDESQGAHGAHTALAAVATGVRLGLPRRELASVVISALLHDAGHDGDRHAPQAAGAEAPAHTREGVRRLAWATTFNRRSLESMRVALEHHMPQRGLGGPPPALRSQLVGIADAYVTFMAQGGTQHERLSPCGALARIIGPLREEWHPALPAAFVEAVGLYPPGQVVSLDDDSVVRTLAPIAGQPERAWIEYLVDERGRALPPRAREAMPLPDGRRIAQALPRDQWPGREADAA